MIATILVIGSVTSKDYQPVRIEFLRQDMRPKFVRIDKRANTMPEDNDLVSFDPIWAQLAGMTDEAVFQQMVKTADEMIESIGSVAAIVMDEASWIQWDLLGYGVFTGRLDELFPAHVKWVVYSNGKVECVS